VGLSLLSAAPPRGRGRRPGATPQSGRRFRIGQRRHGFQSGGRYPSGDRFVSGRHRTARGFLRPGRHPRGRLSRQARGQAGGGLRSGRLGDARRQPGDGGAVSASRGAPDPPRLQPQQFGGRRLPRPGHAADRAGARGGGRGQPRRAVDGLFAYRLSHMPDFRRRSHGNIDE